MKKQIALIIIYIVIIICLFSSLEVEGEGEGNNSLPFFTRWGTPLDIVKDYVPIETTIITETETLEFCTYKVYTPHAIDDKELIIQKGKNGFRTLTTSITYAWSIRHGKHFCSVKKESTETTVYSIPQLVKVGIEVYEEPWRPFLATAYHSGTTGNRGDVLESNHSIAMWQTEDGTKYTDYENNCVPQAFKDFYANPNVDLSKCTLPYGTVVNLRIWDGTKYKYLYNLKVVDDSPTTQFALTSIAQNLESHLKYDSENQTFYFNYKMPYSRIGGYIYKSTNIGYSSYTGFVRNWKEEYSGNVYGWLDIYSEDMNGIFMVEIQVQD